MVHYEFLSLKPGLKRKKGTKEHSVGRHFLYSLHELDICDFFRDCNLHLFDDLKLYKVIRSIDDSMSLSRVLVSLNGQS